MRDHAPGEFNDHTDAEDHRREMLAELGEESPEEQRWSRWFNEADAAIRAKDWGPSLDGTDWEEGYSIDGGYEAFQKGWTVDRYLTAVCRMRALLGFS